MRPILALVILLLMAGNAFAETSLLALTTGTTAPGTTILAEGPTEKAYLLILGKSTGKVLATNDDLKTTEKDPQKKAAAEIKRVDEVLKEAARRLEIERDTLKKVYVSEELFNKVKSSYTPDMRAILESGNGIERVQRVEYGTAKGITNAIDPEGKNLVYLGTARDNPLPLGAEKITEKDGKLYLGDQLVETRGNTLVALDRKGVVLQEHMPVAGGKIVVDHQQGDRHIIYDSSNNVVAKVNKEFYDKLFPAGSGPVTTAKLLIDNNMPLDRVKVEGGVYKLGTKTFSAAPTKEGGYVLTDTSAETTVNYGGDGHINSFTSSKKGAESVWIYNKAEKTVDVYGPNHAMIGTFKEQGGKFVMMGYHPPNRPGETRTLTLDPTTGKVLITDKNGAIRECTTDCDWAASARAAMAAQYGRPPKVTFTMKIQSILQGYSEYSGLGFWTGLFTDEKEIAEKKKKITDAFCETVLLGGTKCWQSKICEAKVDGSLGGSGVVTATESGTPKAAAHIEGDKTQPIQFFNESSRTFAYQYLYRISYYLSNPNAQDMTYNLVFTDANGVAVRAFNPDKTLRKGASAQAVHSSALAKYSSRDYVKVCLVFNPGIPRIGGGSAREACNTIAAYGGSSTTVIVPPPSTQTQGAPAPTQPTRPDFGDF